MGTKSHDEMEKFLKPTIYCDCDQAELSKLARHFKDEADTEEKAALAIFYFVRDSIKSGMDRFDTKASETLNKGYGGCVGKANLQIALSRAAGIPARYAFIHMSKEVLRPLDTFGLSRMAFSKIPDLLPHAICSIFLHDRWIFAESAFDQEMYAMFFKEKFGWNIEWDGENDLIVAREFYDGDFSFHHSLDESLSRNFGAFPPLFLTRPMFSAANIYSNRHRKRFRR